MWNPDWKRSQRLLADGPPVRERKLSLSLLWVFSENSTLSSRYLVALMKSSFHSKGLPIHLKGEENKSFKVELIYFTPLPLSEFCVSQVCTDYLCPNGLPPNNVIKYQKWLFMKIIKIRMTLKHFKLSFFKKYFTSPYFKYIQSLFLTHTQ